MNIYLFILFLAAAFYVLSKSADYFVSSAIEISEIFSVPKVFIGIVLVAFATTAPEFAVSVQSAYMGHPEIALGNAIGSVICDDAVAMALGAIVSISPIAVDRRYLVIAGPFLLFIDGLSYFFAFDGIFSRLEGLILVMILFAYIAFILFIEIKRRGNNQISNDKSQESKPLPAIGKQTIIFILALGGVILSSNIVIWSSINIAKIFSVPETVIGFSVIAIGTSLPEISTCITAALKKEGDIAVGNIIGADIFNVLWIIGVSALVNPIEVEKKVINFAFPWMIFIVFTMLVFMRIKFQIGKPKGFILVSLYAIYLFTTINLFY